MSGHEIAFMEKGSGVPLILVHGAVVDYRFLSYSLEAFSKQYRAISISLRHHYPDEYGGKEAYSLTQHADDVAGFIGALNAGPAHLVGHSYGGSVVYLAALKAPEKVRSVVSAEGMPRTTMFPSASEEEVKLWNRMQRRFEANDVEGALSTFMTIIDADWERTPDALKGMIRRNAWTLYGMSKISPSVETPCDAARRSQIPFLLLQGEQTSKDFKKALDRLSQCLPNTERKSIPGGTHVFPASHPAEFQEAVLDFVSKH